MQTRWIRTAIWKGPFLPLTRQRRPCCRLHHRPLDIRFQSTASALASDVDDLTFDSSSSSSSSSSPPNPPRDDDLTRLPSPPPERALHSPKLAALHARLSLPRKLPLQTLARALVDASADPQASFNNTSLAQLGNNLLAYYASEHIICHYPRIPITVLFAAIYAYTGPRSLATLVNEWGVETAAEPGGEVDPGLLQVKLLPHTGEALDESKQWSTNRPNALRPWRRGVSSRIVYDDEFGDLITKSMNDGEAAGETAGSTLDRAQTNFARAVVGALYLHCGRNATKSFITSHVLSRHVSFSSLFDFRQPTRDLSRLCAREGFEGPVARIISETGRTSRHPVFVVGVYSGDDKLGEGSGSSLDEARTRAAVAALKSWYLYSPLEVYLPSDTEDGDEKSKRWKPGLIDGGEVIV